VGEIRCRASYPTAEVRARKFCTGLLGFTQLSGSNAGTGKVFDLTLPQGRQPD
jgi:hypothetical protein